MKNVFVEDFTIGNICNSLCAALGVGERKPGKPFFSIKSNEKKYTYTLVSKMNKEDCIDLLLGFLVYDKSVLEHEKLFKDIDGAGNAHNRTRLLQNGRELPDSFKEIIQNTSIEDLKSNIYKALEKYLEYRSVEKNILEFAQCVSLRGIKEPYTTERVFYDFRKKYSDSNTSIEKDFLDDVTAVFAKCLMIAFHTSNMNRYETDDFKLVPSIKQKSKEKYIYDPHRAFSYAGSQLVQSTALKFCLISKRKQEEALKKIYYSVDRLLNYVLDNACIIQNVQLNSENNCIDVTVNSFYNDNFTLEWCDEQDQIDACVNLVREYRNEFHKKLGWKNHNYRIDEMCEDGLGHGLSGKWRALAYFQMYHGNEKDICAFCDVKRRIDSNVELGIAICQPALRNQDFVSSLIFFHILNEFGSYIYGGTYDGNTPMMAIFEKCGFKEHLNYDYENRVESYRVRERFVTEFPPENLDELKDSVYYQRQSLQSEVLGKFIIEKVK